MILRQGETDSAEMTRYHQGLLPQNEIPGWNEDLRGLDFIDGSAKTFANGFNLVDDLELSRVMESVLKGD